MQRSRSGFDYNQLVVFMPSPHTVVEPAGRVSIVSLDFADGR
jgi:hypothetical protein